MGLEHTAGARAGAGGDGRFVTINPSDISSIEPLGDHCRRTAEPGGPAGRRPRSAQVPTPHLVNERSYRTFRLLLLPVLMRIETKWFVLLRLLADIQLLDYIVLSQVWSRLVRQHSSQVFRQFVDA